MTAKRFRIGVTAPASRLPEDLPARIGMVTAAAFPGRDVVIEFAPQCFAASGHFAGDDAARAAAFLAVANDPSFDALWVGRGGYGACRIVEAVVGGLAPAAREKLFMGYSDAGSLLAALYGRGCRVAHGPMPADLLRPGGEAAVLRALGFMIDGDPAAVEPRMEKGARYAAFNLTILSHMMATPHEPDLADHVLMVEEVSEHMYRIDRALCHVLANPRMRRIRGLMLGRCSLIPENDPDFAQSEDEVARHWCAVAGVPYFGRADIGHDADNRVVPFGMWS